MGFSVVLTDHVFPEASLVEETRRQVGVDLEVNERLDEDGLIEITRLADGVVTERAKITRRVLSRMDRCRIVVRHGVGYDNIDIAAATEAGICVCNVTDYCSVEVADHTMALLLAMERSLFRLDSFVRGGGWRIFDAAEGVERIEGRTLGLVGFGRIAQGVARRAGPFGYKIVAFDAFVTSEAMERAGVQKVGLEELLGTSDIVSLHVPLSQDTWHLINAERIRLMKPTAWLINAARGSVVDQRVLTEALLEGRLGGAALDTFEQEPPSPDDPLLKLPNVIVTPHAAFYSRGSLRELHCRVAKRIAQLLVEGRRPDDLLNPDVLSRTKHPLR